MSVEHCLHCGKYYDQDVEVEHEDTCESNPTNDPDFESKFQAHHEDYLDRRRI